MTYSPPARKSAASQAASGNGSAKRKPEAFCPLWSEIDADPDKKQLKQLFVGKAKSLWHNPQENSGYNFTVDRVVELLREQRRTIERNFHAGGELCYLTARISTTFGDSPNYFRLTEYGVPAYQAAILWMAQDVVSSHKYLLGQYAFQQSASGFAAMQMVIAQYLDRPEVFNLFASNLFWLFFGGHTSRELMPVSEMVSTTHMWLAWMAGFTNVISLSMSFLQHLGLAAVQRREVSIARTLAFVQCLLAPTQQSAQKLACRVRGPEKRKHSEKVIWIWGASDASEGRLARNNAFIDAGANESNGGILDIFLISDESIQLRAGGDKVKLHSASSTDALAGKCRHPSVVLFSNSCLGTLDPVLARSVLVEMIDVLLYPCEPPPFIICTCYSQEQAKGMEALMKELDVICTMSLDLESQEMRHVRNLFSASAGSPDVDYDENGWVTSFCRKAECQRLKELKGDIHGCEQCILDACKRLEAVASIDTSTGEDADEQQVQKSPVVFWGILDLKYDPGATVGQRVKVLETGDGRASRFSGYGAAIKETFQNDSKLQETIRRAVMVENKKLFHDIVTDLGFSHLRPHQEAYPRSYSANLADKIRSDFSLFNDDDLCVLKLCNRCRGCGVIPVKAIDLDDQLQKLLEPPENVDEWLRSQPADWALTVSFGCMDEQVRHWWSNECPCFIVEEFCTSTGIEKEGLVFDGTMRVGFSLRRDDKTKLRPGWVFGSGGPVYAGDGEQPNEGIEPFAWDDPTPWLDLYRPTSVKLRQQWLGGYWKLPVNPVGSEDLRDRIVSVAKRGTAPVPPDQLFEVYAALGEMLPEIFSCQHLSHRNLLDRYRTFPELGAFVTSRLACSLRFREPRKCLDILTLAQNHIAKQSGTPRNLVSSYIKRNLGVHEAGLKKWRSAAEAWRKSLSDMPANASSLFLLGMYHLEVGQPEEAKRYIEQSLLLDPDFKAPYISLSCALLQLGSYEQAAKVSEMGNQRHPTTPACLYNIGASKFALTIGKGYANSPDCEGISELQERALEALEWARDNKNKDQVWRETDDDMVSVLKQPLNNTTIMRWRAKLPKDGWRSFGWRP